MPTYNRAHLLGLAAQSVLQQTFDDFELVISNGGSTDETREVVANLNDARIRYVESNERLSIGDNYQTALEHAGGEYITFLSDDDAFVPSMFERIKFIIEEQNAQIVTFRVSSYYHDPDIEFNRRISPNTLAIPQFTGEVRKFDSKQAIKLLYRNYGLNDAERDEKFIVSYLANAVYHHSIFERVKAVKDKLFDATPADMYLAAAVLYVTESYFCLDEPLHVWSSWANNSTASPHKKGTKLREHYERLLNNETLRFAPLKFALPLNCQVNAILQASNDFEDLPNPGNFDSFNYFVAIYKDLMYLKSAGADVSREANEFNDITAGLDSDLRGKIRSEISNPAYAAKKFLLTKFPFARRAVKRLLERDSLNQPIMALGDENGFGDFLEAAAFLGKNLSEFQNQGK